MSNIKSKTISKAYDVDGNQISKTIKYEFKSRPTEFYNNSKLNDQLIWKGSTEIAGFLSLFDSDDAITKVSAKGLEKLIYKVYDKMSLEMRKDSVIFVGSNTIDGNYTLPDTNTKVIGADGLNFTNKVVAVNPKDLFTGVDFERYALTIYYHPETKIIVGTTLK